MCNRPGPQGPRRQVLLSQRTKPFGVKVSGIPLLESTELSRSLCVLIYTIEINRGAAVQRYDFKRGRLWVQFSHGGMNYYLIIPSVFLLWCPREERSVKAIPQEISGKWGAESLDIRLPLPTQLCESEAEIKEIVYYK